MINVILENSRENCPNLDSRSRLKDWDWKMKFSFSSGSTRLRERNSRSRLEHEIEKRNSRSRLENWNRLLVTLWLQQQFRVTLWNWVEWKSKRNISKSPIPLIYDQWVSSQYNDLYHDKWKLSFAVNLLNIALQTIVWWSHLNVCTGGNCWNHPVP